MKKVIEKVKEQDKTPEEDNTPKLADDPYEIFDMQKELDKLPPPPPNKSGIEQLDEAFRRAFKYRPKQN